MTESNFWTNYIQHFWNNRPVRLPPLRFSYTHFLTVAILRFFEKGIKFVITIAFYNDTDYTIVFWFENKSVWRYFSLSAHENTWILRTSFTASWKTNNHSSSCTLQMEHHFILPIYIMYCKKYNYRMYQTQEIETYSICTRRINPCTTLITIKYLLARDITTVCYSTF